MRLHGFCALSVVLLLVPAGCGEDEAAGPSPIGATGGVGGVGAQGGGGSGGETGGAAGSSGTSATGGTGPGGAPATGCPPLGTAPTFSLGEQLVTQPFQGVRIIHRATDQPRPLSYQVVQIDPGADDLAFLVTPQNGGDPRETTRQKTSTFLTEQGAQIAMNVHFFSPWPPVDAYANVLGLSVSDGDAYSPFEGQHTIGFNFDPSNVPTLVRQAAGDTTGFAPEPAVVLHNAVGAREQIVTHGANTGDWIEYHPRSTMGLTSAGEVILMVVDGRRDGLSEGMTTPEVADILISDFDVVDAINLDGGGSTALAVADPAPRVSNVPSGGTEREIGSNIAVFAKPCRAIPGSTAALLAYEGFDYGHSDWGTDAVPEPEGGGLTHKMGGTGWASAWFDDFTTGRLNGVAVFPADAGQSGDARTSPLGWVDGTGAILPTTGGQLRTSFGTSSSSRRFFDVSQIDPIVLSANGQIGADGAVLWLSFLAQSYSGAGGTRFAYVALADRLRFGKVEDASGNWGVEDSASGAKQVSGLSSADPVFFVARIEFDTGDERVSVWLNPELGSEPAPPATLSLTASDFTFYSIEVAGRYSTDFDEIRVGTTFDAVTH